MSATIRLFKTVLKPFVVCVDEKCVREGEEWSNMNFAEGKSFDSAAQNSDRAWR